jgi:Resolvase, N terminal domain
MERPKSPIRRCAIYTRKSSEEGLEQDFNSLHAQREACEAFIKSQAGEGWRLVKTAYDDGGLSGGTMERPALQCRQCRQKFSSSTLELWTAGRWPNVLQCPSRMRSASLANAALCASSRALASTWPFAPSTLKRSCFRDASKSSFAALHAATFSSANFAGSRAVGSRRE